MAEFSGIIGNSTATAASKYTLKLQTLQNPSNVGRPIRFVDPTAEPIKEVLA